MTRKFSLSPSLLGVLVVLVFLGGLYFLEPLLTSRRFEFNLKNTAQSSATFPMETLLSVYSSGNLDELKNETSVKLADLVQKSRGNEKHRPLLVNFWATWCDPCIEEIPSLNNLASQLKSQSSLPLLITISVDEKKEAISQLEKTLERPLQFPILHDPDGAFSKQIGVVKFPETFLISPDGKILHKWIGPQDWLSLEVIQQLDILRLAN